MQHVLQSDMIKIKQLTIKIRINICRKLANAIKNNEIAFNISTFSLPSLALLVVLPRNSTTLRSFFPLYFFTFYFSSPLNIITPHPCLPTLFTTILYFLLLLRLPHLSRRKTFIFFLLVFLFALFSQPKLSTASLSTFFFSLYYFLSPFCVL